MQAKKQSTRAQLEDASSSRSKLASEVKGMKSSIQYTTGPLPLSSLATELFSQAVTSTSLLLMSGHATKRKHGTVL